MSDYPDLRTFLNRVRSELPAQILTISEEVPLDYTSTALALELERRGRRPEVRPAPALALGTQRRVDLPEQRHKSPRRQFIRFP